VFNTVKDSLEEMELIRVLMKESIQRRDLELGRSRSDKVNY
jgi:hypothetical protein